MSFGLHPSSQFFSNLLIAEAEAVEIDDLLQMLAPGGLTVEVLFDVVGLDLQLLADVEQER